jgi:hypothetical protein
LKRANERRGNPDRVMRIRQQFICLWPLLLALAFSSACNRVRGSEPEIKGSARFTNQIHQALLLLKARDIEAYAVVTNYIGRIQEGEHSGMWAYQTPPTYEMGDSTAFYSVTWCAATIAHDSLHSKLYHDYLKTHAGPVPESVWTGTAAEQQCMKHQLRVMEHIGANQTEIDYAKKQADGHYVKDHETWQDHEKHNW